MEYKELENPRFFDQNHIVETFSCKSEDSSFMPHTFINTKATESFIYVGLDAFQAYRSGKNSSLETVNRSSDSSSSQNKSELQLNVPSDEVKREKEPTTHIDGNGCVTEQEIVASDCVKVEVTKMEQQDFSHNEDDEKPLIKLSPEDYKAISRMYGKHSQDADSSSHNGLTSEVNIYKDVTFNGSKTGPHLTSESVNLVENNDQMHSSFISDINSEKPMIGLDHHTFPNLLQCETNSHKLGLNGSANMLNGNRGYHCLSDEKDEDDYENIQCIEPHLMTMNSSEEKLDSDITSAHQDLDIASMACVNDLEGSSVTLGFENTAENLTGHDSLLPNQEHQLKQDCEWTNLRFIDSTCFSLDSGNDISADIYNDPSTANGTNSSENENKNDETMCGKDNKVGKKKQYKNGCKTGGGKVKKVQKSKKRIKKKFDSKIPKGRVLQNKNSNKNQSKVKKLFHVSTRDNSVLHFTSLTAKLQTNTNKMQLMKQGMKLESMQKEGSESTIVVSQTNGIHPEETIIKKISEPLHIQPVKISARLQKKKSIQKLHAMCALLAGKDSPTKEKSDPNDKEDLEGSCIIKHERIEPVSLHTKLNEVSAHDLTPKVVKSYKDYKTNDKRNNLKVKIDISNGGFSIDSDGDRAICHLCNFVCKSKSNLRQHLNTHNNNRPYKCEYCDKKFAQNSTLRTHLRIHTGERPYNCKFCPRSFADCSTFIKHRRTHTGEKPYGCAHCGKNFSQSGNLARHIKTTHKLKSSV